MATKRIKDISTTATTFAADDFIALDASSVGTRKMAKASLITQVGANYLEKADNLSDVASKDTSKLNLEVPNVGTAANEVPVNGMLGDLAFQSSAGVVVDDLTVDGQLTAAVGKPMPVNGPSMRFDGVNDFITFADNDAFTFSNGTDDLPFSVSAWVKASDWTNFKPLGKFGTTIFEWLFGTNSSDQLGLAVYAPGGLQCNLFTDAAMTGYENEFVHVVATFGGAGPNSQTGFATAGNSIALYVNGADVTAKSTVSNNASYTGMSDTSQAVWAGRFDNTYSKGHIRNVQLFNKELSAAEVKEVYSNGQLPESFAESTGGADVVTDGGFENWTTSTDLTNWSEGSAISVAQSTDKISGTYSVKLTGGGDIGSTGNNWLSEDIAFNANKKYRLTGKVKRFSGSTQLLQIGAAYYKIIQFNGTDFFPASTSSFLPFIGAVTSKSLGNGWYSFSIDFTTTVSSTLSLAVTSSETFLIDSVSLVQIGSVLDARAEQFDTSTGKLYDLSGNGFVGTQSGGVSLLGREFPVYETGTWTPSITFGGGSTGITYSAQEGYYTRIGDTVFVSGVCTILAVGSSQGTARVAGLPFISRNMTLTSFTTSSVAAFNMTGLTSAITALIEDNQPNAILYDGGATGSTAINQSNFTATSSIRFSGTYQIQ